MAGAGDRRGARQLESLICASRTRVEANAGRLAHPENSACDGEVDVDGGPGLTGSLGGDGFDEDLKLAPRAPPREAWGLNSSWSDWLPIQN